MDSESAGVADEKSGNTRLGRNLRLAREAKGWTQQQLAELVSVRRQTVIEWEKETAGSAKPKEVMLERLSEAFGVPKEILRYGDLIGGDFARTMVREPTPAREELSFQTATAAQRTRIWLEQFILELVEEGADQDFSSWVRRFLMSPQNYALYVGGTRGEMTDDQKLRHMQGLAVGVRAILKDRLKRGGRDEKARGKQD